jgi:ubiquinone biosynthesis protein
MKNPLRIPHLTKNAKRLDEIVRVLAKYGLADFIRDWNAEFVKERFKSREGEDIASMSRPERVRRAFTELGTTFIKLGQVLSTRADLVGPDIAQELSKLQSSNPADPPESVRQTVESELGKSLEALFAEFDENPLGSASIAQVHAARLPTGESVVIKVQHPGIEDTVQQDLEILSFLGGIAEKASEELRLYQPRAMIAEFRRNLLRELDFERERRNIEEFVRNFEEDPTVHFPRPFPELTTKRVLTMERLDGIPIAETEKLRDREVDTEQVAWKGASAFLEMVFRDGFYHADPHPGNIFVLEGDVVGILDCGMAGRIDDSTREQLEGIVQAAADQDSEEMTDYMIEIGSLPPNLDREQLRADITDFVADHGNRSLEEFDLTAALNEMVDIIRRHRIVLRPAVSLLIRMLVLLEGSSRLLSRDFSLMELLQPYVQKRIASRLSPERLLSRLRRSYRDWSRLLDTLPRDISDILSRVQSGTFDVHLEHRRLDPVVNRVVYGVLTASLFLGSSMLWSRQSPPTIAGVSLFGAAGVAIAAGLSLRLFRAIRKEGGLEK